MQGGEDGTPGPVHLSTGDLLRQMVAPVAGLASIL